MPDMPIPNIKEYYIKDGTKLFLYQFYGKPKFKKGDLIPKPHRIRVKGFTSYKAAKAAAMERVQKEFNGGSAENMTVKDLFDRYITNCKANGDKTKSIEKYEIVIGKHVLNKIGGLKLEKVNRYHAEGIGNAIKTSNYASSTINSYIREIKDMFEYAVRQEYIPKNPFNAVDTIRATEQVNPHRAFTIEEMQTILAEYKDDFVLYPFIVIAVHTGMRNSEVCGLQWSDINFEDKTIAIDRQLLKHKDDNLLYFEAPKHNSKGTISIDNDLIEFLKGYKSKIKRKKYAKDKDGKLIEGNSFSFVLVAEDGTPLYNYLINDRARKRAKKGYTKFMPHDLRDTYATWLFKGHPNELKFIQKQLRHKNLSTTLDMYIRLIGESSKAENEKLNDVFGGIGLI